MLSNNGNDVMLTMIFITDDEVLMTLMLDGRNTSFAADKVWWYRWHTSIRPIPGKVKLLLISGKKSASLLDHISRFLSHQFVTWYLRSISKTKTVKLCCPCMSEHMIYIKKCHKRDPNVTPKCRKRDQTKYCIKRNPDDRISYEVYEIVCKYVVRHLCIAQYKIP